MPGFDRSGPMGQGPMTGGRRGVCVSGTGYDRDHYGRGFSRGFGRGRGCRGGRRGLGGNFGRYMPGIYAEPYVQPTDEMNYLKTESDFLKKELEAIHKRIEELEK